MKSYIKPEIKELVIEIEDVIAASTTYTTKTFGDLFSGSSDTVQW